ncbi:MAG: hypothetical protein ACD_48C00152G0008 [uncultured bacterium]|nr:MAG: hypothetical protein ACD_48C00152G0008 [uncultured bacterium]
MTIEIYQPGSNSPIEIESGGLFEAVDGSTGDPVILKSLIHSKGFLSFQGTTMSEYLHNEEQDKNHDWDGTSYKLGDALQLENGVIAKAS